MSGGDVEVEVNDMDDVVGGVTMDEEPDEEETVERIKSGARVRKGRGFNEASERITMKGGDYDTVDSQQNGDPGPARSVEGWILFITNVHEEAQEDTMFDLFREYGAIKNMHLNLDRRTGYAKGYALTEYETYNEAKNALQGLNGQDLLGHKLHVDWAFVKGPLKKRDSNRTTKTTANTGRSTYRRR
ncbi:unnamed protein product [Didymodactylos carnosus]|uniref:RNA-binding protein 8A n=1 Tax=Didymodactylos carnosus TaxID=1234261 RepID=A0A814CV02_9BILA|nr:unnamed protein product [Didymodactylos carnosus]CAF0945223.1 unnamed protein product [Didymodactylos carnosus]CAF3659556.1 unnamed protein product [Didymodactylos carnosus]CAF3721434.1 unnamed protein product [Didymodactylos carnosus]